MKFKFILTDKYTSHRLSECDVRTTDKNNPEIKFDTNVKYQTIMGFGGAFTESSGYNLSRVNEQLQNEALHAYFDKETGLNYTLGRVAINSCDFSLASYDYVKAFDTTLDSFSIARDEQYIVPMITKAYQIAQRDIMLIASPWSPCYWMKSNNQMIRGGRLLDEYKSTWSRYYIKFIEKYQIYQFKFFGVTVQNEPAAIQRWDSCEYSDLEESEFVKNYLGPELKKYDPDIKIYIWDHNRDIVLQRVKKSYDDPLTNSYIAGTAVHWYDNEPFDNLTKHHELYPDKQIISTESCIECGPHINEYEVGERYGRNIIGNFNNYCQAFIDWNLFLDETGGPNWVNNLCSAPILIHVNSEKLIYQLSYYYIGHFSKYVMPNAHRIKMDLPQLDHLFGCAFVNPNGEIIIVLQNSSENDYDLKLLTENIKLIKRSILTIIVGE